MIVFGYVKGYNYSGDGVLNIKVRVPSIHGPYRLSEYSGAIPRNYVRDENLPYYPSLLLPYEPKEGDVVALEFTSTESSNMLVIGLTGGSYLTGQIIAP